MKNKVNERTIALLFALVILITIAAAGAAFIVTAGLMPAVLMPAVNLGLVVAILINGLSSAALWFYGRAHIAMTKDLKKVWDMASGALLSVLWDVLALGLALFTVTVTPGLYLWLGVALIADGVIDVIVHYKR